jgi:hypothetical protein
MNVRVQATLGTKRWSHTTSVIVFSIKHLPRRAYVELRTPRELVCWSRKSIFYYG